MEASRRLLECVDCPYAKTVNFSSRGDVILLTTWLEDRKIRELEIDQREQLRKDHAGWDAAFSQYLERLGCPFTWSPSSSSAAYTDCLSWLISHSISTVYEDLSEECVDLEGGRDDEDMDMATTTATATTPASASSTGEGARGDQQLRDDIDRLGLMVTLTRNTDENDAEFLQRISRHLRLFLTEGSRTALTASSATTPLQDFPLGFDTLDAVVNQIALVLRMLYISDFRELQNDLNALIVLGQEYTANPKTNSAIGKVGR